MNKSLFCFILLAISSNILFGQVTPASLKAIPFPLHDIQLTGGPLKYAQELNEKWLQEIEPDRLLSGYRMEAGLKAKAPKYGGWESTGLSGHSLGHYLSALSLMFASTGNPLYKERIDYICRELSECQKANRNGFTAGFPNASNIMQQIANGDIRTKGFDINGAWVPYYNMHKLFAGLIDATDLTASKEAKKVLQLLAEWFYKVHNGLNDEQIQQILICEYGGMNEALTNIYRITGDEKYLHQSFRFNHQSVLDPLSERKDKLAGQHANTQIPKVVGTAAQYLLSRNEKSLTIAQYFFEEVINHHTYCIGGNSSAEYFGEPGRLEDRITDRTCETCNSYNMLKLDKLLFMVNPSVSLADYYEKTIFNHIYASQNNKTGMVLYFSPLATGSKKEVNKSFSTKFDSFWCCVGSGWESHAKYGECIYFKTNENDLIINQFIESQLEWTEKSLTLSQATGFPEEGKSSFTFKMKQPQQFSLYLRVPGWSTSDYRVFINGKLQKSATKPGNYMVINRKWNDGDKIDYLFPMPISSVNIPGDEKKKALQYGPIVLSANISEDEPAVLVTNGPVEKQIEQISTHPLRFKVPKADGKNYYELMPYYENMGTLAVYFDTFNSKEWHDSKEAYLLKSNKEKYNDLHTIDKISIGEIQPERDHQFASFECTTGERLNRKIRETAVNGWMEFTMKTLPDKNNYLIASFYGNNGSRTYDIFVDNQYLTTDIIHWMGDQFIEKSYNIPIHMTKNKNQIIIKLSAKGDGMVPPVTEVRTIYN